MPKTKNSDTIDFVYYHWKNNARFSCFERSVNRWLPSVMLDVEQGAVSLKNEPTRETNVRATRMTHLVRHLDDSLILGHEPPSFAYRGTGAADCAHMGSGPKGKIASWMDKWIARRALDALSLFLARQSILSQQECKQCALTLDVLRKHIEVKN